jgi:hypothetical protein
MSLFENKNDALDGAVSQIKADDVDPAVIEQAAARVWERLSHAAAEPHAELAELPGSAVEPQPAVAAEAPHTLRNCEDFQALIPAYLRGELPPARALLVEDHTRSCVPCRRALREAREGKAAPSRPAATAAISRMRPVWMTLAALLVLGLGTGLFLFVQEMLAGGSRMAKIESIDGALFRIDGDFSEPIRQGTVLAEGDEIRTAKGSTAMVRMTDGSLIEMSERAGLRRPSSGRATSTSRPATPSSRSPARSSRSTPAPRARASPSSRARSTSIRGSGRTSSTRAAR